jgi:hypothetical protein
MTETNYPQVAQAGQIADKSYDIALTVKIDCPAMLDIASDELRGIVTRRKEIEELRLSITRPMDAAKAKVMELFKAPTDRLGQAESLLRDEITRYRREEQEKADAARREAEARLAAERAEAERREREAEEAARAAQESGDAEAAALAAIAAEDAREQRELAEIAPPPVPTTISAPKPAGISSRKNWKAEITDFKALVLEAARRAQDGDDFLLTFLAPDDKVIGQAAKAMQAKLNVPGVRVYAEDVLSVCRKAG